jgi:hypothetical protein
MRDIDPALVKQILDIAQRERKADLHHHGQANDFGRCLEIFERIAHRGRLGNRRPPLKPF